MNFKTQMGVVNASFVALWQCKNIMLKQCPNKFLYCFTMFSKHEEQSL